MRYEPHLRFLLSFLIAPASLYLPSKALAQAFTFDAGNLSYSQNFDSIGETGTAYPTGWDGARVGGSGTLGPLSLVVGTGSSGTGAIYNFGVTGVNPITDRAVGLLASGTTIGAFGASFALGSGLTVTQLSLSGFAEQWRSGDNAVVERTVFEYALGATGVGDTAATWVPLSAMDLVEIQVGTTTAAALDGNATANRVAISGSTVLNWSGGTTLWIRWRDNNDVGADAAMALDDFSLNVTLGAPPKTVTWTPTTNAWNTTTQNWLSSGTPATFATGDTVVFDATGLTIPNVAIAAGGVSPGAISVNTPAAGDSYTFSGGSITTSGTLTKIGAGNLLLQTVFTGALNVQAGSLVTGAADLLSDIAALTVEANGAIDIGANNETIGATTLNGGKLKATTGIYTLAGNLTVGAGNARIEGTLNFGTTPRTITLNNAGTVEIAANITGTQRITLNGAGTVKLEAANTGHSSSYQLNSGVTLSLGTPTSLGAAQFFFNGGTLTAPAGPTALAIPNTISLGGSGATIGPEREIELAGTISFFGTSGKTLVISNTTRVSAAINNGLATSNSALTIRGAGRFIIAGANNSFASLTVDGTDGGTVQWDGTVTTTGTAPVTEIILGGRLTGSGSLASILVTSGTVAPGTPLDPTMSLTTTGIIFGLDSTLALDLGGTSAGQSDQIIVNGTVTLGGNLLLTALGGMALANGDVFTLIANDGNDAVQGAFSAFPDNFTFELAGIPMRIDYDGGTDGNDVILTVIPEPSSFLLLGTAIFLGAGRRNRPASRMNPAAPADTTK